MSLGYALAPAGSTTDRVRQTVALLRRRGYAVGPGRLGELCLGGQIPESDVRWAVASTKELMVAEGLVVERDGLGERQGTRAIAARAARLDPALATTAFIKEDREGKVFLDSTRAFGATVAAAYSPRVRPGVPVSFPVRWDDLDSVAPGDFTVRSVLGLLDGHAAWAGELPAPQVLPPELVEEGRAIPVARVQAMHEGKRRARARRDP